MKPLRLAVATAVLLTLLPFMAKADQLDTMLSRLDRLERMFWKALPMRSDTDYHKETTQLLSDTVTSAREIQTIAARAGSSQPNLTAEMHKIRMIFDNTEPFAAENYRFNFQFTSLRDYEKQFYRDNPALRKKKEKPTMANINLADYERWLDEIVADNGKRVRRLGGKSGTGAGAKTDERMKAQTISFFQAVSKIRLTLARYRQDRNIEFPE